VVLFPHAGGGPAWYAVWGDDLPPDIELKVLHLPGRGSRHAEAPATDFSALITTLSRELVTVIDVPYILYGHSLGALIAFETAREMSKSGRERPERLIVSGCPAPHLIANRPPISDLPEAAFIEELRRLGGTPPEVLDNSELLQLVLPSLRSDMALFESYILADNAPLDCPITALGGSEDKIADRNELEGWRAYTVEGFSVALFDGDHFFIRRHRGGIARILAAEISV
jgi:medium-chain acyl-[acyl-carrier-protein] hydrolase